MSISFTGLASGLPINDIITQLMAIEQQPLDLLNEQKSKLQASKAYVDNIETRINSLKSSVQKFTDGNLISTMDLFKQKSATSSDEGVLTATAGANAVPQTLDINVISVATATKAESNGSAASGDVANVITGATTIEKLANGTGEDGTFTINYTDNSAGTSYTYTVTINAGDDINTIMSNIGTATGNKVTAALGAGADAGKIILTREDTLDTVNLGANGDTSNFLTATQLDIGKFSGTVDFMSANPVSAILTSATLTDNSVNFQTTVTAGTFTIGQASFTIDATTTLNGLINQINGNSDAKVTASYNLRTNKIDLISLDPGKKAITLGAAGDTSNFLTAINLVNGTDTISCQTLGTNAQISINGSSDIIECSSNTITSTSHGLTDLTLSLSDTGNVTVKVQQDIDKLSTSVEDFINNFNTAISYIDEQTNSKTGTLPGETTLIRLRNNLRQAVTDLIDNSSLISFASIGITTGSVGLEGDAKSTLSFDKDKFLEALQEHPEDVRSLFIGNTSLSITGVMQTLSSQLDTMTDATNGYFYAKDQSIDSQIDTLEDNITRMEAQLEAKEELLKKQFSAMETAISKMNSQASNLTSATSSSS